MITRFFNKHFRGAGGINELFAVALPLYISSSCETVMLFTDRYFLSKLGSEYMSASLGGGLSAFMFFTFFLGLIGYGTALVAQYFGARKLKKCPLVFTQSIIISLFAYPSVLLCIPLGCFIFEKIGIPREQLEPQKIYFKILMYGAFLSFAHHSITCYFSGIGRTGVIMVTSVATMAINVFVTYTLVSGHFGFPALGVRGAAIGTVIGHISGLSSCLYVYLCRKNRLQFKVKESFKFDKNVLGKIFRFGYPAGIEFFLSLIAFNFFVMTFQSYSISVSTAVTIMFNWENVYFLPLLGMNTAVTSLVGRYIGAKNYDIADRITRSGLKIVFIYAMVGMVCFLVFAGDMVDFFRPDKNDEIFNQARPFAAFMLGSVSFYLLADALGLVYSGALRGAGDTFGPMCISIISSWSMFLTTFIMVRFLTVKPEAIWIFTIISFWSFNLMFFYRYRSGKWRNIKVIE
ncbi:MAG: MATE family efflux transporter [Alphaproteobacteria bacterium]